MTKLAYYMVVMVAAFSIEGPAFAQTPDGSDIDKAIPIYFGQKISDIGDKLSAGNKVYSITLAKG